MPLRVTARSKYGAQPTVVDGVRFHSQKEAKRYGELKLLVIAGEIYDLELQPRFVLTVPTPGEGQSIGEYRADFAYRSRAKAYVVEDVKGFKTPLYRWKKRHVEAQHGITILET